MNKKHIEELKKILEVKCKIDSHVPTENGKRCLCGYFTKSPECLHTFNGQMARDSEGFLYEICDTCKEDIY